MSPASIGGSGDRLENCIASDGSKRRRGRMLGKETTWRRGKAYSVAPGEHPGLIVAWIPVYSKRVVDALGEGKKTPLT
jgi:hypothetical protein